MSSPISFYDSLGIAEARSLQDKLRANIRLLPIKKDTQTIAGADISLNRFSEIIYAGIVVLRYIDLQPIAYSLVQSITRFPYVPGFLAFREVPALVEAFNQIPVKPDVIMVDGHGIAHPRRMGIAAHLGALIDVPTLGCAKKILFGKYEEPDPAKGNYTPIMDKTETIGYALRSKNKVKEIFISPGNNISFDDSMNIAMNCVRNHRLPEPTRRAHEFVNLFRTGHLQAGYHEL
jgi:deoxyribonuclease V